LTRLTASWLSRAFVFDVEYLLAAALEEADDHLVPTSIEADPPRLVFVGVNPIVVDDELVIDEQLAAVIRGQVKRVRASAINLDVPFEPQGIIGVPLAISTSNPSDIPEASGVSLSKSGRLSQSPS